MKLNNYILLIGVALGFSIIGFCAGQKSEVKNETPKEIVKEKIVVHLDTIHIVEKVPVIKYKEKKITDTLKIVKYQFSDIGNIIKKDKLFQIENTNFFCSKPFEAVDTVKGKFGSIVTKFNYPELLFDYDIYSIDTTITKEIYIYQEPKLHWTQEEWFIYTTNAVSLVTGVLIGSQATR